jgi:hypothetical protein
MIRNGNIELVICDQCEKNITNEKYLIMSAANIHNNNEGVDPRLCSALFWVNEERLHHYCNTGCMKKHIDRCIKLKEK